MISILSLYTSKDSLEISQKAYFYVTDGTLQFDFKERSGGASATMLFSGRVHNSGRTPATIDTYTSITYLVPTGWELIGEKTDDRISVLDARADGRSINVPNAIPMFRNMTIPSGETSKFIYGQSFLLDSKAYEQYIKAVCETHKPTGYITVLWHSEYKDVFNKNNELSWTWGSDFVDPYPINGLFQVPQKYFFPKPLKVE